MSVPSLHPPGVLQALLRRHGRYRWALRIAGGLLAVALLADLLANEKPIFCTYEGEHYFPALSAYTVALGWSRWPEDFHRKDWHELRFDRVLRAPVPYGPGYLDLGNSRYRSPLATQNLPHWRYRHWLGTDALGRDVLAALIHGTRSALLVGLLGTVIALLLGLLLGGVIGFYGDDRFHTGPFGLLLLILALAPAGFYAFWLPRGLSTGGFTALAIGGGVAFCFLWLAWKAGSWVDRRLGTRAFAMPLDLTGMRFVEAVQAMPGLLLILALFPLFQRPSIWNVVLVVGLIRWPSMARFVRAELLRIREQPYIEAARLAGIPDRRLWWRHALPNALQPVLVLAAFSMSSGILLEAFLAFLGMGLPAEQLSWGSLLNLARHRFSAWWLAVFPGLGIFLAATAFNLLGEALQEWLDPRQPYLPLNGAE